MKYSHKNYKHRRTERNNKRFKESTPFLSIAGPIALIIPFVISIILGYDISSIPAGIIAIPIWGGFILYFRKIILGKHDPPKYYSNLSTLDFREPNDATIEAAIDGIFSFSKSQPYYIHVTPPNDEAKDILKAIEENGFIHIHGKPGEGKSMLAFHTIYKLLQAGSYECYLLKLDTLSGKTSDIIKDLLNELDILPTSFNYLSSKLILIDDAHRLTFSDELEQKFQEEAKQGNGRFIWISTDLDPYEKLSKKKGDLSINFQKYFPQLIESLYQSEDKRIKSLMIGKFPSLNKARNEAEAGKIKDSWTFNFAATGGFDRLKEDIFKLSDEEKYLLYFLSAYTSIVGEIPLSSREFYSVCDKNKPVWFQLSYKDFEKTLTNLFEQKPENLGSQKRRMMLRLTKDDQNNVWVESLHFLFAINYVREVSETFLELQRLEMLNGVKAILDDDWPKFRYFSSFISAIREDQELFFKENSDWIKKFFEYPQQEYFHNYYYIVRGLIKVNEHLFNGIFTDDYFQRHSIFFSQFPVIRFHALHDFIYALPSERRSELIAKLDLTLLSGQIIGARIENFNQVADLINAIGNRKEELINQLKLDRIIEEIGNATIENFSQVAFLINALGSRKEELINQLRFDRISEEINNATIENIAQVGQLIKVFSGMKEVVLNALKFDKLANEINLFFDANQFKRIALFIDSLPGFKKNNFLDLLIENIKKDLENSILEEINKAEITNYESIAHFIGSFGNRKEELLKELIKKKKLDKIIDQISEASIENFGQVEAIINAFGNRKEELLKELIEKKKLDKIIDQISGAGIEKLNSAADLINSFGNRKDELVSQIDFNLLNRQINKWQPAHLMLISEFILSIGVNAGKVLIPFSEEKFLALTKKISNDQIRAFTIIFSRLPMKIQTPLLDKIPWLALLNKSPIFHYLHLNNITRIMQFYLQIGDSKPNFRNEIKSSLQAFVETNQDTIAKMILNTKANNYRPLYNSILILCKIDKDKVAEILKRTVAGFGKRFEISPGIGRYITRLLNLFYVIDPVISFKTIWDETVNNGFKNYFRSEKIHEIPEETNALIKALRNSNRSLWENEFMMDESITTNLKNYDLPELYKEQDEDQKQMKNLGIDYFKIDSTL